jgi:hypothetical protein
VPDEATVARLVDRVLQRRRVVGHAIAGGTVIAGRAIVAADIASGIALAGGGRHYGVVTPELRVPDLPVSSG